MPRTIRNEFDKKLTYDNLMKAHILSRKGKGYRDEIILFNLKQEEYIMWLLEQLKTGKYKHGGYTIFYVTEPKFRRVEKSRYIDRIVHRFVVDNFLKEYFEKCFIYHTYACIKNRGMHKAVIDVQKAMKHCKIIWEDYYILKMDIRKYFDNINKDILFNILKRKISDKKLLLLLKEIVYSNCTKEELETKYKQTVHNGNEDIDQEVQTLKGLPIGNYTSQLFANIYLNELDQYIKHKLKIKYYFRYLDDMLLFTRTKKEAKDILKEIQGFLKVNLQLELNEKTQIFKSKQGVNFCGYKINEYRLKIRDRGKQKLKKKIKELKYLIRTNKIDSKEARKYLTGHIGYIHYANINNLSKKVFYVED